MLMVSQAQWEALREVQRSRFEKRLTAFMERHFEGLPGFPGARTPAQAAHAAIAFSGQAWAMSERDVTRVAIALLTANRLQVPPEDIACIRDMLLDSTLPPALRLQGVELFLGIDG